MNTRPAGRRRMLASAALAGVLLGGCATDGGAPRPATVEVKLIAFNDLHGNLDPPGIAIRAPLPGGGSVPVPAGGAAYLASAIASLEARNPRHAVISAGDLIGASPLVSALFLDEPTIEAVNAMHIDFNAVGNHELDKGPQELLRMQNGGCARFTARQPCRLGEGFAGANFRFLAANTLQADGSTLFPGSAIKTFKDGNATVRIGFIGLTLRGTASLVTPSRVAGLRFADEAHSANALVPQLKAQGADAIVVVLHQGGFTEGGDPVSGCQGLSGPVLPILDRLDPAIEAVISGHTHRSYVCDYTTPSGHRILLTSAGQYGTLLTDIDLGFDPVSHRLASKSAVNRIVQGEAFGSVALAGQFPKFDRDSRIAALIERYRALAGPLTKREVGRLAAPVTRQQSASRESALGELIADAQLAATRAPASGGAQIAFMNPGGMRADLVPGPDGSVDYGQLFGIQPFGNTLVVKTMTGAQIRALLEQQFASGSNTLATPRVLLPSQGFSYAFDLRAAPGARISGMRLDGRPVVDEARYRVTMNDFLAAGGDNFSVFEQGTDPLGGGQDVDALEAYIAAKGPAAVPVTGRILNLAAP